MSGFGDHVVRALVTSIDSEMGESIGFIQTAVSRLSGIIDGLAAAFPRAGQVDISARQDRLR